MIECEKFWWAKVMQDPILLLLKVLFVDHFCPFSIVYKSKTICSNTT